MQEPLHTPHGDGVIGRREIGPESGEGGGDVENSSEGECGAATSGGSTWSSGGRPEAADCESCWRGTTGFACVLCGSTDAEGPLHGENIEGKVGGTRKTRGWSTGRGLGGVCCG